MKLKESSRSGTPYTNNFGVFKATEVCDIIKACKDNGVTLLKLGELELRIGTQPEAPRAKVSFSDTAISETQAQIEKVTLVEETIKHKQDRLDQMLIEDPVEAERLIESGELELEEELDGSEEA